jgi:predicted membrane channel-forming protein YqfA (hemolysin III family)
MVHLVEGFLYRKSDRRETKKKRLSPQRTQRTQRKTAEETATVYSFTHVLAFRTAILRTPILRVQGVSQFFVAVSLFDSRSSLFFAVSSPFEFFFSSSYSVFSVTSVVNAVFGGSRRSDQ